MSSTDPSPSSSWEPPSPEHLQRMLPQYEITDILGRGGMGAVYKGRQSNLDREVAIKVLPETFTKGNDELNFAARFKQEARAMAKLDHPAILSVYDFGETSDGQLYFIMEFIDGMDIHQYLHHHGGKLPQDQALSITAHVLDALDYAHSHGIVHRDIKPANILLNREGRVKIADFGLAKKLEEEGGDSVPALTMTNVAVGTPDFVAPEALDSDQKPDHRADLYAVGVMLYQMLTGKLPRGQFKAPSDLDSAIDPRLDDIVSKALQPHPDDRYSSAAMVRADLDVIFSQPFAKVEAGEENAVVAAVVPVTTSLKGQQPKKAGRYTPATPEPSKMPLFLGIGAACVMLVGLAVMATRGKPGPVPSAVSPPMITETPPVRSSAPEGPVAKGAKASETKNVPASPVTPEAPEMKSFPPSLVAFPPGEWVKVFTKAEDLPEELRKPDSGVKFEEGWIRITKSQRQGFLLPLASSRNYGVRARVRRKVMDDIGWTLVTLRESVSGRYLFAVKHASIQVTMDGGQSGSVKQLFQWPYATPVSPGQEYLIEVAAVGDHLTTRYNDALVHVATDASQRAGTANISGIEDLRDIEIINLDGLPEAEALRILGVDEKGNDLRALAAKEEQQQMAQAKAADALAAIPELKALHEQFIKLQAERVTAPFEAEVAKLNAGYVGGIDREIASEKKAGHLDGVIALEAEKKLVTEKQPSPARDDASITEALKKLRGIYRAAYAEIEATRAVNLNALADPLDTRLKQLEATLTQQDRIAHAKTVREYREGLGRSTDMPVRDPNEVGAAATMSEAE